MNSKITPRRQVLAGIMGVLGGGLLGREAQAFPSSSKGEFGAASRILERYGVTVSGDESGERDVLNLDVTPPGEIDYVSAMNRLAERAGIDPSPFHRTTTSGELASFEVFDPKVGAGIDPSPFHVTTADGAAASFSIFDTDQGGGILPCVRVAHEAGKTVFEHFDPNAGAGILPCFKTAIDGGQSSHALFESGKAEPTVQIDSAHENGALRSVAVQVDDPDANFRVSVGGRLYSLQDGELVEERIGDHV